MELSPLDEQRILMKKAHLVQRWCHSHSQIWSNYSWRVSRAITLKGFIKKTLMFVLNDRSDRLVNNYVSNAATQKIEIETQRRDNEAFPLPPCILDKFSDEFSHYVQEEMVQPVVRVISTLPKEEMAAMAEALVEITTLRRKVDSTVESVGGPTDVAIISKGDGLVWIKRKHYFNMDLNQDFLRRKRFKHGGGDAC